MEFEPKDQRVPVMMSASEVKAVDAWRRSQENLPSRGEAMRRLVELGLKSGATWKLMIYGSDGSRLPDRNFANVDDLLADAEILTSTQFPSKLSVSIPNGASKEDREKVRLIAKMHG